MSEENIELRFEVEQANKDIPRLKVGLALFSSGQISIQGMFHFCRRLKKRQNPKTNNLQFEFSISNQSKVLRGWSHGTV